MAASSSSEKSHRSDRLPFAGQLAAVKPGPPATDPSTMVATATVTGADPAAKSLDSECLKIAAL